MAVCPAGGGGPTQPSQAIGRFSEDVDLTYDIRAANQMALPPAPGRDGPASRSSRSTQVFSLAGSLEVARAAGAAGGKICGAGGGGYLLLACSPERRTEVRAALEAHRGAFADFAFSPSGVEARVGDRVWRPTA